MTPWLLTIMLLAQQAPLRLHDVARVAIRHPKVELCVANTRSVMAMRDEARAAELPSLYLAAQLNRGTGNVVPGSAFATPGVPATMGPPRGDVFNSGTWTTIASLGASFEVNNFIRRVRDVDAQTASLRAARDRQALCELDAAYEASAAFLDVVALTAGLAAVEADRERADALRVRTAALTRAAIRPGAELAQADAELASVDARTASLRRDLRLAQARLTDALGSTAVPAIDVTLSQPAEPKGDIDVHPQMRAAAAEVVAAERRIASTRIGYLPRLEIAAALWARGSGYPGANGTQLGPSGSGLAPDVANWLVGAVISWDVLDLPEARARVERAEAEASGSRAVSEATRIALVDQLEGARDSVIEADVVVTRTAPAVEAARIALSQAEARYTSGLSSFLDVARVRQLLIDAELAHVAAQVAATRSRVMLARAAGDIAALTEAR